MRKYHLEISVCRDCLLIQQTDLLPKDIVYGIYKEDYYSGPSPAINQMGRDVADEFYAFFKETMPASSGGYKGQFLGKLLEIACFDGFLLQKFEKNWDVYGCDPSTATRTIALNHLGKERIRNEFFSKESYGENEFDVIIFRNVLEHLYDLHAFLDSVSYCLKPEGCIYIQIPNIDCILDNGSFGSFFHQHITYFSVDTIKDLLNKHGFKIVNVKSNFFLYVKAVKTSTQNIDLNKRDSNRLKEKINGFYEKAKATKNHLKSIFNNPKHQKIAIFGASVIATVILDIIGEEGRRKVKGVFDNDSGKQGKYLAGGDVIIESPTKINENNFDAIVISTFIYYDEIFKQLTDWGVDKNKIFLFNGLPAAISVSA